MDLFNLAARLTLDSDQFDKGLSGAEKSGKGLASSLEGTFGKIKKLAAGALSVAAIKKGVDAVLDLANATAEYGDRIDKQSQVLGMSRKAYQEWDYILGQNGASIDSMATSMKTLNSLVLNAAEGSEEAKDTFAQLGLSIHEIEQLNPEDQFEAVVRAFQKMPAGAQKSALAVKIFGKNGMELLPLLNQSATSIDELRAKAEEMGIIMSDDAVDASVAYGDAMDDLTRTFNGLKYSVGAKLLPALTQGVQKITGFAGKISKAFQENGLQGVWDTLVEGFKNIKWPTWSDVRTAIENGWNTIVEGVKGLAKLVFGENVDGTIKWPTWEEIGAAIETAWKAIVQGVSDLGSTIGKLVFGENVDGTIDWPTWEEVGEAIGNAWKAIVQGVSDLGGTIGKLIFGSSGNVDGSIKWPTWGEIKEKVESAWQGIVDAVSGLGTGIGKAVFGQNVDGTIKWPTWEDIGSAIETAWRGIVNGVKELGTTIGKVVFGENVDGTIKIPTWDEIAETASTEWQKIKDGIAALGDIIISFGTNLVGKWFGIINGWLDGTGLKDITFNIASSLTQTGQWLQTAKEWLEKGLEITISFGSKIVSQFINTVQDWIQNGIRVAISFFKGNSGNSEWSGWESEQNTGPQFWDVGGGQDVNESGNGFAKGLNFVPFDRFPALLHRGEQIVTASQARRNRANSGGLNTDAIASAVAGAIRSAMQGVSVNSYLNGQDITNNVDRDMARKLKARRFAT